MLGDVTDMRIRNGAIAQAFCRLDSLELEETQVVVVANGGGIDSEHPVRPRILPAAIAADLLSRLAAKADAGLDVVCPAGIEVILGVGGKAAEDAVALVVPLVQFAVRVVFQVEDARSGHLGENGPRRVGGLVQGPAHAGEPGAEKAAGSDLRAVVAIVLPDQAFRIRGVVVERKAGVGVLGAGMQLALRVLESVAVRLEFEGRGRHGPNLRHRVGEVGQDGIVPRGLAGGIQGGDGPGGERTRPQVFERALMSIVVDAIEKDAEGRVEAIVDLQGRALVQPVVVDVGRAVVPHVRGAGGAERVVLRELIRGHGVLAVEHAERHPEVAVAAEGVEDLLVAERGHGVQGVIPRRGIVVVEEGRPLRAEAVDHPALFLQAEGRAGLHVDIAAQGIGVHVGRRRLGDFDRVEEGARNAVGAKIPVHPAGARHLVAIDRHGIERVVGAAHHHLAHHALAVQGAGDARQPDEQFARLAIGEIAVGVERDDALDAVGVPLGRQRGGVALAFADHAEFVEPVDVGAEVERNGDLLARINLDQPVVAVESDVGDAHGVPAGGKVVECEPPEVVGERAASERGNLNGGAFEQRARRAVAHLAGDATGAGFGPGRPLRLHRRRAKPSGQGRECEPASDENAGGKAESHVGWGERRGAEAVRA